MPTPPDPDAQIAHSWQANAAAWTQAVRDGQIASRRLATDAAIVAAVLSGPHARVLDVGCGEGWLARRLAEHGAAVTGVDGSAELIAQAQAGGGGDFRTVSYAEIIAAPAALGGPYDAIVCNFALLGDEIAPLLAALAARLAPGGRLLIQTVHPCAVGDRPYADGWRLETFASFGAQFAQPMPWYFRTLGAWLAEVRAAGLHLADCREPVHPETGRPVALLLVCTRGGEERSS